MKKRIVISVVVLMCIALLFSSTAQALWRTTYNLDELDMSIDISDDYDVFTRDTSADDPLYVLYGITKESFESLLEERYIYLDAIRPDGLQEIVVTMIDSLLESFNSLSGSELSAMASTFSDTYEAAGITYLRSEIYESEQAKFIKIYMSQEYDDQFVYSLQYYTVCNNRAINIIMHSYEGEITQADEVALKEIVDSADFRNGEPVNKVTTDAEPFEYTDMKTGVSFTVPANWTEIALSTERETIDAKFASTQEKGITILYGSVDLWGQLTESEKGDYLRSEFDYHLLEEADVKDFVKGCGLEDTKVSQVSYGGRQYFMVEGTSSSQVYGMTISTAETVLLRVENGYLFHFWFAGESSSSCFKDFIWLLNSVKYPEVASEYRADPIYNTTTDTYTPSVGSIFIASLLVTVTIYSLPIIIYRYAIIRRPVDRKKAKRITIVYGIVAFCVMAIFLMAIDGDTINGGAILLWSWVNYRMLIGGRKNDEDAAFEEEAIPREGSTQEESPTAPLNSDKLIGETDTQCMNVLETTIESDLGESEKEDQL